MADKKAENFSTGEKLALAGVPWPVAKQMQDAALLRQKIAETTAPLAKDEPKDKPTE